MHNVVVWLQRVLIPSLGPFGMFLVAFCDSSFLSLPEVNDLFVVTSAAHEPGRAWVFILVTTLGSLSGCSALWLVGKKGGEPFLRRRFGIDRVERTRSAFRRWDVLALALPALLPPPMPFKMFVFSAGVFGVAFPRFLLTLGLARGLRYAFWGTMGALYGERAVARLVLVDTWLAAHATLTLSIVLVVSLVAVLVIVRRLRTPAA
jgi:membrane protein YqaA with SNARE-associated domain